jgi:hypothetical protein
VPFPPPAHASQPLFVRSATAFAYHSSSFCMTCTNGAVMARRPHARVVRQG